MSKIPKEHMQEYVDRLANLYKNKVVSAKYVRDKLQLHQIDGEHLEWSGFINFPKEESEDEDFEL